MSDMDDRLAIVDDMYVQGFLSRHAHTKLYTEIAQGWPVHPYYGYSGPHRTRAAYLWFDETGRYRAEEYSAYADELGERDERLAALRKAYDADKDPVWFSIIADREEFVNWIEGRDKRPLEAFLADPNGGVVNEY